MPCSARCNGEADADWRSNAEQGGDEGKMLRRFLMIDVFSDASHGRDGLFTGAYMIGHDDEPTAVEYLDCQTSTDAELLTSAVAICEARGRHPEATILAHSDLWDVQAMVHRGRTDGALALRAALSTCEAAIHPDANYHQAHQKCHYIARVTAKCYGEDHPQVFIAEPHGIHVEAVMDILRNHPLGVSQSRISEHSGLEARTVQKVLRFLERKNRVRCERPDDPIAACDLECIRWLRGASFGTRLGGLLEAAGIASPTPPAGQGGES